MEQLVDEIAALRRRLGDAVCIMGHHYQNDAIVAFCDVTGDSLELARRFHVSYVVFHVCDVKNTEFFTNCVLHTDEEVVDAAAELINELLDGKSFEFEFHYISPFRTETTKLKCSGFSFTSMTGSLRLLFSSIAKFL